MPTAKSQEQQLNADARTSASKAATGVSLTAATLPASAAFVFAAAPSSSWCSARPSTHNTSPSPASSSPSSASSSSSSSGTGREVLMGSEDKTVVQGAAHTSASDSNAASPTPPAPDRRPLACRRLASLALATRRNTCSLHSPQPAELRARTRKQYGPGGSAARFSAPRGASSRAADAACWPSAAGEMATERWEKSCSTSRHGAASDGSCDPSGSAAACSKYMSMGAGHVGSV